MARGRLTLQTVADRLGVTKMTVSNAYARPEQVSPKLRERILAAAEELGYPGPDPSARALVRGRTGTVGVLLTDQPAAAFSDQVALGLIAGVARALSLRSLSLVLLADQAAGGFLPPRDVAMDGAVVYGCSPTGDGLRWLLKRRLPVVGVDQFNLPDVDLVNIDDRGGARAAAAHLGELGHRRVGGLVPWVDNPGAVAVVDPSQAAPRKQAERWGGWCEGLAAFGVAPRVAGLPVELNRATAAQLAARMLTGDDPPTAILCFSDVIAAGVLDAAAALGIDVPSQLSVVGFDGGTLAEAAGLTTVRQDQDAKGAAAVQLLFDALDAAQAGETRSPRQVTLPTELVVRGSTGPAENVW